MSFKLFSYFPILVDGVWKDWADWSKCTVTCGYGTQIRKRDCHGPFYKGADCVGNNTEIQSCNTFSCPGNKNLCRVLQFRKKDDASTTILIDFKVMWNACWRQFCRHSLLGFCLQT